MHHDRLHVITCVNNPVQYESRWRLYEVFRRQVLAAGAHLVTVELAYGDRPHRIAAAADNRELRDQLRHNVHNETHVKLRAPDGDELWHKENLQDIGATHLPGDCRKMAFCDADILFQNPRWVQATLDQLDLFKVVQMFDDAQDLGPNGQRCGPAKTGFVYSWWHKLEPQNGKYNDPYWHPGYCWAWTRRAYDDMRGLFDLGILGSGDWHMAMGLIGKAGQTLPPGLNPAYRAAVLGWQERARHFVREDISYVPGMITHLWHGKKKDRGYQDRWQILLRNDFNPATDLVRDRRQGGLLEWSHDHDPRMRRLRDDVRRYLRSRNEDSVDVI